MDEPMSVSEIKKSLSTIQKASSGYAGLSQVQADAGEVLHKYLQSVENLKPEYITAVQEQLFLNELQKQSNDWLSVEQAEAELSESKEIVSEIKSIIRDGTSKVQDTVDVASDAVVILLEKMDVLSQKIGQLEEKHAELTESTSADASSENLSTQLSDVSCTAARLSELIAAARAEREIVQKRIDRVKRTLQQLEEIAAAHIKEERARQKELDLLKTELKELEKFSGIQCQPRDDLSVDVTLTCHDVVQDDSLYEDQDSIRLDASKLTVTLTFCKNQMNCLQLTDVQIDKAVNGAETLIKTAKQDKDLPKLIMELKKLWIKHVPINTEISCLRKRHAIDWIQEKGILQLMVRKSNSIVCTLRVPASYPFSGNIVLENVMGHTSDINPENFPPPPDTSLKGWVQYLETYFSK